MTTDWDSYLCRLGSDLASIYLDLGRAVEAPKPTHPHCLWLSVAMLRPREDGMSSQDEFEDLLALEDSLAAQLAGENAVYVGRNTTRGFRVFYFYAAEPELLAHATRAAMNRFPAYEYELGQRLDSDWSVYFDFLYPSPDDYQRIRNRRPE